MRDLNRVIRYLAYTLELLVLFMVQETPGLLPHIYGVRPVLLLPAVVAIALFEEELPAMAFGIVGGLFCDFGLACPLGFHGVVLAVLCFLTSIQARAFLQVNILTAVLTGIWAIGLAIAAQWLFLYYFSYSMPGYAFTHHYLPKYFYTLLFLPALYFLNKGLYQAVRAQSP